MGDISLGSGVSSTRSGDFKLGSSDVVSSVATGLTKISDVIPLLVMPLASDLSLTTGTGSATFARVNAISTFLASGTGLITAAGANVARFEANGLLMEGAIQNKINRVQEFDNAAWTKTNIDSVTPDAIVAPDGTTTADKLIPSTASGTHAVSKSGATITGHVYSVFAKTGGYDFLLLSSHNTSAPDLRGSFFDLANGTLGNVGPGDTPIIQNLTNSWNRCKILPGSNPSSIMSIHAIETDNVDTYAGDGTSGIHPWGAQYEALAFSSSYIPTVAAAVTRSADSLDVPATNIPAPTADYTIAFECDHVGLDSALTQVLFNVEGETSRKIEWDTTTGAIKATHGAVTSTSTSTFSAGTSVNVAFVVDGETQTLYINGVRESFAAKGTASGTATAVNIGHQANTNEAYSHIKTLQIDSGARTAVQVAAL